jgi:hypothetical protein
VRNRSAQAELAKTIKLNRPTKLTQPFLTVSSKIAKGFFKKAQKSLKPNFERLLRQQPGL